MHSVNYYHYAPYLEALSILYAISCSILSARMETPPPLEWISSRLKLSTLSRLYIVYHWGERRGEESE